MMIPLIAIFWAAAASAGDVAEIPRFDVGVHPALVPALAEPASAALGLLENRAGTLAERAAVGEAAQYMAELSSPEAPEADRLAAGALARLVVEPGLAASVAGVSQRLAHLPESLSPGGPYRGAALDRTPFMHLALSARKDPAVAALFDGGAAPALELSDAGMDGSRLMISGDRAPRLRKNAQSDSFAHAGIDGVAVEVYHEPLEPDAVSPAIEDSERTVQKLARIGAGARLLGVDVVFAKGLGPKPMRVVSLREHITGKTAFDIASRGSVSPEDRAQIARTIETVAKAGYDVSGLDFNALVLGETALKGLKRAAIVDPAGLKPQPSAEAAAEAAKDWMRRFDEAVYEARRAARVAHTLSLIH